MLSFTVRLRFDQQDHEKVSDILCHLTAASRQEPGCVSYIPHFVEGDNTTVLIYEQYQDEAALDHHRNAPLSAHEGPSGGESHRHLLIHFTSLHGKGRFPQKGIGLCC
jgi:quinol monooxygenase YgiN